MSPTINHPMKLTGDSPFEEPPMRDVGFGLPWWLVALVSFAVGSAVIGLVAFTLS